MPYELSSENITLFYANNKGADQPAQSDQRLYYWLIVKYYNNTLSCYMNNPNILATFGSSAGQIQPVKPV